MTAHVPPTQRQAASGQAVTFADGRRGWAAAYFWEDP